MGQWMDYCLGDYCVFFYILCLKVVFFVFFVFFCVLSCFFVVCSVAESES